jgi:hypothetical protein
VNIKSVEPFILHVPVTQTCLAAPTPDAWQRFQPAA